LPLPVDAGDFRLRHKISDRAFYDEARRSRPDCDEVVFVGTDGLLTEGSITAVFVERDGKLFFRSGDMGRIDEEGYFFMTDRLKRMINASGFKVWPAEVEALMFKHPAIQEACIISTKDTYRGESVKAVVVLRSSHKGQVSEQNIIDWCRDTMAVYKVPRVVEFMEALPKSGSGKVMWRALQEAEMAKV
jgi:fatty-acyl-CoA synthase